MAILPAAGCLTTRTPDLQQEIEALRAQIAQIQKSTLTLEEQVAALRGERGAPGAATDLVALDSRIDSLESQISAFRHHLDETQDRIKVLSQDLTATRELALRSQPPRVAPSQPPGGDGEEPGGAEAEEGALPGGNSEAIPTPVVLEDTYNAAYADFSKGNFSLAIAGFQDFLKKYSQSELADNAQYWIGESYYAQGDYENAAVQYEQVIRKYPKADRLPAAYLKKGLSYLEMNRTPEAVVLLQHLIEAYPASEEAALARDRLQEMGLRP